MTNLERAWQRGPLLWAEDDNPDDFFVFERAVLAEDDGWEVLWARTMNEAAEHLRKRPFAAVILDQRLPPFTLEDELDAWGGCKLLYWLRQTPRPQGGWPWPEDTQGWRVLADRNAPRDGNRAVPVAIVSIHHDARIRASIEKASAADIAIPFYSRPLDIVGLRGWLNRVAPTRAL